MITLIDGAVSKRLEDFGMFALMGHEHQTMPSFENKSKAIAGKFGLWNFGYEINGKSHKIPVCIIEHDKVELQLKLNELASFLFDQSGGPKQIKLIYDYEPDKFYVVRVDGDIAPSRKKTGITEFDLLFISEDPFKYSNVFSDEITWGSELIAFGSTYLMGQNNQLSNLRITSQKSVNVQVGGQNVHPIIEISGSATNLELYANGKKIVVGTFSNTIWRIECDKFISYKNGTETMLDMDNFVFKSGENIVFISGSGINILISAKYRERWL